MGSGDHHYFLLGQSFVNLGSGIKVLGLESGLMSYWAESDNNSGSQSYSEIHNGSRGSMFWGSGLSPGIVYQRASYMPCYYPPE